MATNDNILSSDDIALMFNQARTTLSLLDVILGNPDATDADVKALLSPLMGAKTRRSRIIGGRTLLKGAVKTDFYNNGGAGYNALADVATDDPFIGSTAVEITTAPGIDNYLMPAVVLPNAVDVTNGQFVFQYKPISNVGSSGSTGLHFFDMQLMSAGSPAAPSSDFHGMPTISPGTFKAQTTNQVGVGAWQRFMVPVNQLVASGAGATLTAIKYPRIRIRSLAAGSQITKMQIGPVKFVPNRVTKAKVIFTFDDAKNIPAQRALLNEFDFPGVFQPGAAFTQIVNNNPTNMKPQQFKMAHDFSGWQMGSQATFSEAAADWAALTDAQAIAQFAKLRALYDSLGLTGGEDGSYFSDVLPTNLRMREFFRLFFRTMRTYLGGLGAGYPLEFGEMFPWGDPLFVRALNLATYGSAGGDLRLINHVEQAVLNKGVAIFATHNEAESNSTLLANFRALCVWLDANRSTVDVVTYEDLPWWSPA